MTRYLLDTVVFLWNFAEPDRLNPEVRLLLQNPQAGVFLSSVTSWEMSIKAVSGKLQLPEAPRSYIAKRMTPAGLLSLAITHEHALRARELPRHHADPFDRMLVAQAQTEGMVLITADRQLLKYSVQTLWSGK
jgi:PIN domain nuclease of toxin-antitoxin system